MQLKNPLRPACRQRDIDAIRLTTPVPYILRTTRHQRYFSFFGFLHESLNQGLGHFLSSKLNFLIHLLWYLLSKNVWWAENERERVGRLVRLNMGVMVAGDWEFSTQTARRWLWRWWLAIVYCVMPFLVHQLSYIYIPTSIHTYTYIIFYHQRTDHWNVMGSVCASPVLSPMPRDGCIAVGYRQTHTQIHHVYRCTQKHIYIQQNTQCTGTKWS